MIATYLLSALEVDYMVRGFHEFNPDISKEIHETLKLLQNGPQKTLACICSGSGIGGIVKKRSFDFWGEIYGISSDQAGIHNNYK
jgi:metal-dependent hydrolase (beta-lactamase superfamily II)